MTVHWAVVPAPRPIGALTVVVGDAGLCRVAFGSRPGCADEAARRLGEGALKGGSHVEVVARQLGEYLQGRRRRFDLDLDWRLTKGTQRSVLQTLYREVGYGRTVTYAELAARARSSGSGPSVPTWSSGSRPPVQTGVEPGPGWEAARGVGAIMGSNPLPVVVPCHRVTAADGLGGFGGGRATKEWLLALEGVLPMALDLALDRA